MIGSDLLNKLISYGEFAPWIMFVLILLAGANIPISIDVLLVASAFISATILPEKALFFFTTFTAGCIVSAWISYWIGRKLGYRLFQIRFFSKFLNESKVEKMASFYKRYGFWTFLVGRFIPFGVRNCLFMSSGIAKMSFPKFILFDAIACSIWSTLFFFGLYYIGHDYDTLLAHLKTINIWLFSAFGLGLTAFIARKIYLKRTL